MSKILTAWVSTFLVCLTVGCSPKKTGTSGLLSLEAAAAKAEAERVVAGEGTADPGVADQAITGSSGNLAAEMEARVNQQRGAPIVPNADGSPPSRGGR